MFHVQNLQSGPERLVRFLNELQAEVAMSLIQVHRKRPLVWLAVTIVEKAEATTTFEPKAP